MKTETEQTNMKEKKAKERIEPRRKKDEKEQKFLISPIFLF